MNPVFSLGKDGSKKMLLNLSGIPQDIIDKVLKPEAVLHAQELVKLTFPRKAADGKNKVATSVRRLFVTPSSDKLMGFHNKKIQDRVNDIKSKGDNASLSSLLKNVWKNSSKGTPMPLVEASRSQMERYRVRDAKWRGHARGPKSISTESSVKRTISDISKEVGGAKKAWVIPGVKAPGWVLSAKSEKADVSNITTGDKTVISITNNSPAMNEIEKRAGIAEFVVKLRAKKVMAKINFEVKRRISGS